MTTILNAPGQPPKPQRVEEVALRTLDLDESHEPIPTFYIPILTKFLTTNPADDHFILELPDEKNPQYGGSGFGAITCMEDECWCNINLTHDPDLPDGGKANGIGSFFEYIMHCQDAHHIKCRNLRLQNMNTVLPAGEAAVFPPDVPTIPTSLSAIHTLASSQAGPSRLAAFSSSTNPPEFGSVDSSAPSNVLRDHPINIPTAPVGSSSSSRYRDAPLNVDSDSDDSIEFVGASSPRKNLNSSGKTVVVLDDDDSDSDVMPFPSSSQSSRLQSSQPSRAAVGSQSNSTRRWIPAWAGMNLTDRRHAVHQELRDLSKSLTVSTFDGLKAVARRKEQMRSIQASGCLMQWTPPEALVLQAFPNLYCHPRLADTFERPKPVITTPGPPSADAGPSTQPMANGRSYKEIVDSYLNRAPAVIPTAVKAAWNTVDHVTRSKHVLQELQMMREAITRWRGDPTFQGVVYMLNSRFQDLAKTVTAPSPNHHWMPPMPQLLKFLPQLRDTVHPSFHQFLPPPPADDEEDDPYGIVNELNRPTGKALHDYFQDALQDFKEDSTVEEGVETLGLNTMTDKLPGANFTLMAHQILGVAFMVNREKRAAGSKGGRGGLLCDAMGLGKTVQCIGLMLSRDERPSDYERAPQLIVAPLALLTQWKTEIETKTTLGWRVYIHHGANRTQSAKTIRNNYDIVLTTYGTLSSESGLKGQDKKKKKKRQDSDDESDYLDTPSKKKGPLFQIQWFRVILDEAHNCRNKRTITAKAVLKLDVLHPWVLTGTPIVNSLADFGPALEFIGAMDIQEYHDKVVNQEKKKPRLAAKRCQAIMRPLMIRRNKDTELNGRKILELPPKTTNMAWQEFELDERAIYAAVEQRAKVRVSKFLKAGTLMKNYSVVLVLLTRLRQCVNHPWLLRRKPGDEEREGDLMVDDAVFGADLGKCRNNDEDEYGRAVAHLGEPAVKDLVKKLEERYKTMTDEADQEVNQDLECSICYEPFDGTEVITPCSHLFCQACISNFFIQPVRDDTQLSDDEVQAGCRSCPMCRTTLNPGQFFRSVALYHPKEPTPEAEDEDEDDIDEKPDVKPSLAEGSDRKGKKRMLSAAESFFNSLDEKPDKKPKLDKGKGKGKEKEKATWADDDSDVEELEEKIPPSTKMRHLLELVQGYLDEDPNVKILVFSQFVQFLDLLRDFLDENDIRNVGYRGSMSQGMREEAIRRFSTPTDIAASIPVMLISTKAGGVGLNLTMASKVIMCDLAWNPATENQAVDRAHRIGQAKPVQVERLLIRETVEDRLLEIQERKGLLADGAMGEGDIGRLGRLTLADIRRLFAIDRDQAREDE